MYRTAVITALLLLPASLAFAFNPDGGDLAKGKESFTVCRKCHDGSKATSLSPSSKTKKQWGRFFEEDMAKLKKKMPEWDSWGYTNDFLENVHRYVVEHALDSDKPQTCD
jgi:hypothetical protein